MRVLVTGASGFIGRYCCGQLSALGNEVHGVSSGIHSSKKMLWHRADLMDAEQVRNLVRSIRPTHLLHLAWYAEPGKYWTSKENYRWVRASLNLLEEFEASGGQRIVVAGSCAEYDWESSDFSEASALLRPKTEYGTCKHSLQMMLASYCAGSELTSAWGRVFSIYGPYEHPERLCSSIIQGLLNKRTITCGNGRLVRDYLHVSDVAKAFVQLLDSDLRNAVNICSGVGTRIRDIVEYIERRIGNYGYLEVKDGVKSADTPQTLIGVNSRLCEIGWRPAYDMKSGLTQTIDWFKGRSE